jgi:hypothetical protein
VEVAVGLLKSKMVSKDGLEQDQIMLMQSALEKLLIAFGCEVSSVNVL